MLSFLFDLIRSRLFWIATSIFVVLVSIYLFAFRWQPETQIRMKQSAILVAIENGSHRKLEDLIAETYADPWKFSKTEVITAFRELRQQFLVVDLLPGEMEIVISGDQATLSTTLSMNGSGPSPIAAMIVNEANRVSTPWVFTWVKEDTAPWSWRLIRVENEQLPDLRGYQPGEFQSLFDGF